MIKVAGSARRSFIFPSELPWAYAYYADIGRVLAYLPHICLVRAYGPDRLRLLYSSTELGIYRIHITADVQTLLEDGRILRVRALEGMPPVQAVADGHSVTAQGYFSSTSIFYGEGSRTRIEYSLQLGASLPTPSGLRFMPDMVLNQIAGSITQTRMREIVAGFIERSIDVFPHWLAEMKNHASWPHLDPAQLSAPPVPDCPDELV
jgi:hypothetical protein